MVPNHPVSASGPGHPIPRRRPGPRLRSLRPSREHSIGPPLHSNMQTERRGQIVQGDCSNYGYALRGKRSQVQGSLRIGGLSILCGRGTAAQLTRRGWLYDGRADRFPNIGWRGPCSKRCPLQHLRRDGVGRRSAQRDGCGGNRGEACSVGEKQFLFHISHTAHFAVNVLRVMAQRLRASNPII